MAPYHGSSFDSSYGSAPMGDPVGKTGRRHNSNQEDVIFSLTERLREREDEIRRLRQDNADLENQLTLRGNPIKLDAAYEELLAHLKQREEDFRAEAKKREARQRDLERENKKLREKVHASRKLLDEQERNIALVEKETDDELIEMRKRMDDAVRDAEEKARKVERLEDMVDRLTLEAEQSQKEADEDKDLLSRLGERVEEYKRDMVELERSNDELERRVETQRLLLKEKEEEILHMETFRDRREDELNDDMDRMRQHLHDIINSQRVEIDEKDREIDLLCREMDRYEGILGEAEYVTHEQRGALRKSKKEIEELSMAIERSQDSGLFGQLDKMCSSGRDEPPLRRYSRGLSLLG